MRNVLAVVPKGSQDMVASIIRTVFAEPDRDHSEKQCAEVTTMLVGRIRGSPRCSTTRNPNDSPSQRFPRCHW